MNSTIQSLQGVLIAIVTTVGIAVAVSIALMAAGSVFERDQARVANPGHPGAGPARRPAPADEARDLEARDLVLR